MWSKFQIYLFRQKEKVIKVECSEMMNYSTTKNTL
jgi:hypothetical protein